MIFDKYKCGECNTVFIVTNTRHHMNYCPKCKKCAVDLEEHYCRHIGNAIHLETFEPPHFEDVDEYYSVLSGWLNDSDEKYRLEKYKSLLLIIKE